MFAVSSRNNLHTCRYGQLPGWADKSWIILVYVYVYVYLCIYIYVYIYIYLYTYLYIYIYTCIYIYKYVYTHIYIQSFLRLELQAVINLNILKPSTCPKSRLCIDQARWRSGINLCFHWCVYIYIVILIFTYFTIYILFKDFQICGN